MKPAQIPLNLTYRTASGRDNFLVAPPNEEAVTWIDRWPDWPGNFLMITGPSGCGKSHLTNVWQDQADADVITLDELAGLGIDELAARATRPLICEDMEGAFDEEAFLHLYNIIKETGSFLLMTAKAPPAKWPITLPDLRSRLGTVPVATVREPDDQLFASLIIKHFSDRQLAVDPDVVQYLLVRLERSFDEARKFVKRLDAQALAKKRKITLSLIRELLKKEQG